MVSFGVFVQNPNGQKYIYVAAAARGLGEFKYARWRGVLSRFPFLYVDARTGFCVCVCSTIERVCA